MSVAPADHGQTAPLAIICGSGALPFVVADAAIKGGRKVVLFALRGFADGERLAGYPHHWMGFGQFGRFCRIARAAGCREVVMIGGLVRPNRLMIIPDLVALRFIPEVFRAYRGGDDHLLSGIARIFEQLGFRFVGAHEIAPELLVPEGIVGSRSPTAEDRADIVHGLNFIEAAGLFDVGQSVVVIGHHIVAVEAAEGTDGMLARIADLRRTKRITAPVGTGVVVKAPKPRQDRRFDLPTIGPRTIEGVADAGLAGIAVVAGEVLIAEPQQAAIAADRANIFMVGVPRQGEPA